MTRADRTPSTPPRRTPRGAHSAPQGVSGSQDAATRPVPAGGRTATRLPHAVTPLWAWAVITAACLAVVVGAVAVGGGW